MTAMSPPPETAPIATVIGGSGFVGRYIVQRLARRGWRVRVAVRRPNEALFVKPYGVVGQVAPIQVNVRDDASMRRAIEGATAVVYSVGVLYSAGKNSFRAVQAEGPARAARIAATAGVERFVLISAIGAETKFQPVYVDDVAEAAAKACAGEAEPGATYELGGPRVATFRALMEQMLTVIHRRRPVVEIPGPLAMLQGAVFEQVARIGLAPPVTRDQIRLLAKDNVVAPGAKGFEALGIAPTALEAVLGTYLYPYRPYGQFDDVTRDPAGPA